MKRIFLSFLAVFTFFGLQADEGMWIPKLIGKNIEEMQQMGLRLSADDLYHANNASLKDAIVHFGGGCTGEMISKNGLLITNHHCGYGNIANLSTVENNYLEDGFWAKKHGDELPAKGLSVKFLIRMEDVTEELAKSEKRRNPKRRSATFQKIKEDIEKEASEDGKYEARIVPFFNGNQYILMVHQIFTDVRLVATPPKSLGKYGGDTDNWIWPRHTADFAVFRVYADKNNNPAAYSIHNVPYQPKKFLPISVKGVEEGDFAMVMGYPGRTNRYETSYGVDLSINVTNPSVVKIRDMRLKIMMNEMKNDKAINLKLTTHYSRISNYWKYFIGQTEQLKRLNIVAEKQKEEREFSAWAAKNYTYHQNLMSDFAKLYAENRAYAKHNVYYSEAFAGSELAKLAARTKKIHDILSERRVDQADLNKEIASLKTARENMMNIFVPSIEREILARTAEIFYDDIPRNQLPDVYQKFIFKQFAKDNLEEAFDNFAKHTFYHTFLLNDQKFEEFCKNPTIETLEADPAVVYAMSFVNNYETNYRPKQIEFLTEKEKLSKQYIAALMQKDEDKQFYPDANSTMRITYGTVGGYSPKDAVYYNYYTTMDGLLAKYIPGDYEFDLPQQFINLVNRKEYGQYADKNGELVANFITNNDITGGNSGSPIINGNGELLGLAFDGNWEAMSGDIAFDQKYKKTIAVDIRFVLWLIEKYGGAKNIIDEMEIVK